jgi:RNA polymerase sigma-70 factor (ECF subfamily)
MFLVVDGRPAIARCVVVVELVELATRLWRAGREAWPDIELAADAFIAFVADPGAVAEPHAAELYLASACAAGNPVALAIFEREWLAQVGTFLQGIRPTPELVDEVRQLLRERLFVGDRPRIREYTGRGSLAGWLRISALRLASNLRRGDTTRHRLEARSPASAGPPVDPELALIRARHGRDFESVLADAFATLEERERNVLRLHFLDGLGIDALAAVFRVHRSTAHRWLSDARATLNDQVRARLRARLSLGARELESLMRVVRSELEISLRALLGKPGGA